MRWTTFRNSVKEGIFNILRHPIVTLASVTTIALMLFIMGSFTVFSMNARAIMTRLGQQPPIELTLVLNATPEIVNGIEQRLAGDPGVIEYTIYTPEENLASFKKDMEDEKLFEGFSAANLPHTITVRLADPSASESFAAQYSGIPGVNKVSLEVTVMAFLSKAIVWINYATLVAFAVLLIVSLFIISNMVRIAVFSRGEEINIMKYVGATNWYIRVPFIIEGALVGLLGALTAFAGVYLLYDRIFETLMQGTDQNMVLAMLPKERIAPSLLLLCLLIGISIGSLGSAFSVRRHIKV
jgi:cell division transport system permease protein